GARDGVDRLGEEVARPGVGLVSGAENLVVGLRDVRAGSRRGSRRGDHRAERSQRGANSLPQRVWVQRLVVRPPAVDGGVPQVVEVGVGVVRRRRPVAASGRPEAAVERAVLYVGEVAGRGRLVARLEAHQPGGEADAEGHHVLIRNEVLGAALDVDRVRRKVDRIGRTGVRAELRPGGVAVDILAAAQSRLIVVQRDVGYRGGGPAGRERRRDRSAGRRLRVWTPQGQRRAAPARIHHWRVVGGLRIRAQRDCDRRARAGAAAGLGTAEIRAVRAVRIGGRTYRSNAVLRLYAVGGDDGIGLGFGLADDHVPAGIAGAARLRGAVGKRDAAAAAVHAEPVLLHGLRRVRLRPGGGLAAAGRGNHRVRCRRAAHEHPVVENVGARRLDVLLLDRVLVRLAAASDRAAGVALNEDHVVVAL